MPKTEYLIYGASDFGILLKDFLDFHAMPFGGFIDDFRKNHSVIGTFEDVVNHKSSSECEIVLGLGYNNLPARLNIMNRIRASGFRLATLIHQNAYVRDPSNVHQGSIIMANVTIDYNVIIAEAAVLWPGVVVNHDSRIGRNTFLSPSATICGFVNIGESCFIGAGAIVIDHVDVPSGSFIKAGALYGKGNH